MSWKITFIIGLCLSLSPFRLNIGRYSFLYSLLGYSLVLISFLYKEKRKKDILIIINLFLILIFGLINVFNVLSLFEMTFFLVIAISLFIGIKSKIINITGYVVVWIVGFCLPIMIFNCIGFDLYRGLLNVIFYALFSVTIISAIFSYRIFE